MADPSAAKQRCDERGRQDRKQRIGRRGVFRHCGRRRQGENVSRILQDWTRRSLLTRLAGYYCLEDKAALERERDGP